MASARLLAARHEYRVDPDRELVAQGAANIAIAFGHGFPSGGGLSQSLVNDAGGARTPVAVVVCSAWMAVVLVYLTGLFVHLPQPLLYFNAETVREEIEALKQREAPPLRLIILDLSFSTEIDLSTVRMLAETARLFQAQRIAFRIAEAHYRIREQLIAERLEPLLGDLSRLDSVAELVAADSSAAPVPATA